MAGLAGTPQDIAECGFAFRLFRAALDLEPGQNVFLSPASIAILLHMIHRGAEGETQRELAAALGAVDNSELGANAALWLKILREAQIAVQLRLAASLWIDSGLPVRPEYVMTLRNQFECKLRELDLHSPTARDRINEWVSLATRGTITHAVDAIDPQSLLMGVTTVYFNGLWHRAFDRFLTHDRAFHLLDGTSIKRPFMATASSFWYAEDDEFQAISLPYSDGRFVMRIFLPRANLARFCRELALDRWHTWTNSFCIREGSLELTRFKVNYSCSLEPAMLQLGITTLFDPRRAELGGIVDRPLWLGNIEHKAVIEVNEEGTQAAAATVGSLMWGESPQRFTMVVDRPFLCAIVHQASGAILFLGAIFDPK